MGFQSDIYLGWVGKNEISKVMGPDFYEKYCPDEYGDCAAEHFHILENTRPAILKYLDEKHDFKPAVTDKSAFEIKEYFTWEFDGEDVGEDCHILGVQLTDRYSPAFLDFREEHGGLYVKLFNQALLDDIEWFRNYLITERGLAHYATAQVFTRDNWY